MTPEPAPDSTPDVARQTQNEKSSESEARKFLASNFSFRVAATVICAGWMFVEDWPMSLYGCLSAIVIAVLVAAFVWLFRWGWRVVGKKSNDGTLQPPGARKPQPKEL